MKKLLTAIVSATFLFLPITGFAAYIIHLKDGGKIVTDQYFEEGDQIKFRRYGGIIGIKKNSVLKIEQTEAPADLPEKKETTAETEAAAATTEKGMPAGPESGNVKSESIAQEGTESLGEKEAGMGEERKKQEKAFTEKEKRLVDKYEKEFHLYKTKFRNVELMTMDELDQFYTELNSFRKVVITDRLSGFFAKQLREVYSMLDKIQSIMHFKAD